MFSHFAAPSVKTTMAPKTTTAKNSNKTTKDVKKTDRTKQNKKVVTGTPRTVTNITQKANKNTKMVTKPSHKVVNNTAKKVSTTKNSTSKGLEKNKTNVANSTEVTAKPGEKVVGGVNLVETNNTLFSGNLKMNCVTTKSRPSFVIW